MSAALSSISEQKKLEVFKMNKNVLVISTSPRQGGNSDVLADAFVQGAEAAGHQVEKVTLRHKTIGFCQGCLACQKTQRCTIKDDANEIVEKMQSAQVLVFATPIYYYGMCGQMKTLLDRANPLYSSEYAFRDVYLLASAAEDEEQTADGTIRGLSGWIDCFSQAHLAGTVFAGGVDTVGAIKGHPALTQAYELGQRV